MMKKFMTVDTMKQEVYCNRGYAKTLGEQNNYMNVVA